MINNILKIIITIILSTYLYACTKPIPITIPQARPKLCIASQVVPNQLILVTVTYSFTSLYSNNLDTSNTFNLNIFAERARVTVSYNSITDTLLLTAPGVYGSINTLIASGTTYTLNVYDSATNETVSAVTTMQTPTKFDDFSIHKYINKKDTIIDTLISFKYSFADKDLAVDNYYYVSLSKANPNGLIADPTGLLNIFNLSSTLKLYSDAQMKNGILKDSIDNSFTFRINGTDTLLCMVGSISKEYFQYLTAFKKSNSILNQLTGEPINYPTNIVNGYGFFNAQAPDLKIKTVW